VTVLTISFRDLSVSKTASSAVASAVLGSMSGTMLDAVAGSRDTCVCGGRLTDRSVAMAVAVRLMIISSRESA